jgi:hypothetical protein
MDKEYMCREGRWTEGAEEPADVTLRTGAVILFLWGLDMRDN